MRRREPARTRSFKRNLTTERPFSLAVSNRETASCHTVAGTCAGRPWALDLRPGAREDLPTHRPNETVNVRALEATSSDVFGATEGCVSQTPLNRESLNVASSALRFAFSFPLRSGCWKRIAGPRECSTFSLGGFLCLSFSVSVLFCVRSALSPARFQYSTIPTLNPIATCSSTHTNPYEAKC